MTAGIDELATRLVQQAPALDGSTIEALRHALQLEGSPLAQSIARAVELVDEQLVDPGIALPAIAEACATLVASHDPKVLEAARYQIDTLEPVPDRPSLAPPDVPVGALRRPRS